MSQGEGTVDWTTYWRRGARATVIFAALAMCLGGVAATQLAWRHARSASLSAHTARGPMLSPDARGPIVQPKSRELILSAEAHELLDDLAGSAAVARRIHVGLFRDQTCCDEPEPIARILEAIPLCLWEPVTAAEIQSNRLDGFDVVIFPGGRGHKQAEALGEEGRRAVRDFVRAGGGFVGICAGTFLASAQYEWSLGLVNTRTLTGDREMPGVGIRSMADRGPGTVQIELTDAGRAVFGDFPGPTDVNFSGGPILLGSLRDDLPPFVPLAYYRTELTNYEPQRGTMIDTASIVAARYGSGRVIAISPHPETTPGIEFLVERSVLATARKRAGPSPGPSQTATSSARRPETVHGRVSDRSPPCSPDRDSPCRSRHDSFPVVATG